MAEAQQAEAGRPPKRILFVDEDRLLLDGLRDALRPYRDRWAMGFVDSGEAALAVLAEEPQDVVVSDLRMPGIDGVALLEAVRERCPTAVRIVFSGHADVRLVALTASAAHRLVAKPCRVEELIWVIERSCALQELALRVELRRRALGASALPPVPRLYTELSELLARGLGGAAEAARIVEQDVAIAAKVLQLANSAYFARRTSVTRLADAVAYLGLDALRALVLHAGAFAQLSALPAIPGFDLETLQRHCARVARLASALAPQANTGAEALTAGLLHDIGLLVLASQDPEGLAATFAAAAREGRPLGEVERERHGVTHAEVGAHLLDLWGLPHDVVEAVAGHQSRDWLRLPFDGVGVVHVANALVEELEALPDAPPPCALDLDYLRRAGLADQLPRWRELAARALG